VVPNTLARRAFAGTNYECLNETLIGPTLLAFTDNEPSAAARLLRDFAKGDDKLVVKSLSLGKGLIDKSQLNAVASLPTKDEAIARLAMVIQAPITKFVRTLAEPHSKLVRVFAAVRDKKRAESA
jgi:large subunit ribosomal protein L10